MDFVHFSHLILYHIPQLAQGCTGEESQLYQSAYLRDLVPLISIN